MTKPFYKVSYKNSTPALPILLADFTKLFSSIADFGKSQTVEIYVFYNSIKANMMKSNIIV